MEYEDLAFTVTDKNGKEVEVYNTQNAKRCVTQYLYEIKQED